MNILAHSNRTSPKLNRAILISLCVICCALSGCKNKDHKQQSEIAVANSYLNAVVKDLCGDQQRVFDLVPPGMCPGHFDISPSQVNLLCNCKILFVFDFQQNIENAIPRIKERGLKVSKIAPPSGLCIPDTYLAIARQVAGTLSQQNPQQTSHYEFRLKEIKKRLEKLSQEAFKNVKQSGLQNTNVLTSQHQKEFVKWLGLNPVSTFTGRETATPAQINLNLQEAEKSQIKLIIANQQEGTEMAQALATHLKVKLVVFSNFPYSDQQNVTTAGYDDLVHNNINRLIEAMK